MSLMCGRTAKQHLTPLRYTYTYIENTTAGLQVRFSRLNIVKKTVNTGFYIISHR